MKRPSLAPGKAGHEVVVDAQDGRRILADDVGLRAKNSGLEGEPPGAIELGRPPFPRQLERAIEAPRRLRELDVTEFYSAHLERDVELARTGKVYAYSTRSPAFQTEPSGPPEFQA